MFDAWLDSSSKPIPQHSVKRKFQTSTYGLGLRKDFLTLFEGVSLSLDGALQGRGAGSGRCRGEGSSSAEHKSRSESEFHVEGVVLLTMSFAFGEKIASHQQYTTNSLGQSHQKEKISA